MSGGREHDAQLALETLESLDGLEEQMSFFRPAGEISRINLLAAEGPLEVEPELFQLLFLASFLASQLSKPILQMPKTSCFFLILLVGIWL